MAAALYGLEVVGLAGLDGTEARAAARDVDYERRKLGSGHVGYTLLHKADAGAGRGGHDALARGSTAVDHVDGCHFALGLQHHHAGGLPGLLGSEGFEHLRLRSDGIAEIAVGAAAYGGMGDGFVALH